MDNELPSLPPEVIHEILLKLPVKSLSRFKGVSKTWLDLISGPEFIKSHRRSSARLHDRWKMLVSLNNTFHYADYHSPQIALTQLESPSGYAPDHTCFVGCCNGLVLLFVDSHLILWNPCTNVSEEIWYPFYHGDSDFTTYGLAYDTVNDDYLVIRACSESSGPFQIAVFSLNSTSWRKLGEVSYGLYCYGVTHNGSPHWVDCVWGDYGNNSRDSFVYFDAVDDTFKKLPKPKGNGSCKGVRLCTMKAWLCAVYDCDGGNHFDIWGMREYGVNKSWNRLFSFKSPSFSISYIKPVCFTVSGEVAMVLSFASSDEPLLGTMVSFNVKTMQFSSIIFNSCRDHEVLTYVECLAHPCREKNMMRR